MDRYDTKKWLTDLREKAEAFRVAMVESGAVVRVSQDTYMPQLRALEAALEPLNYLAEDRSPGSKYHHAVAVSGCAP